MSDVEQRIGPYLVTGDRGRVHHVVTVRDVAAASYQGTMQLVLTDIQLTDFAMFLRTLQMQGGAPVKP